MTKLYLSENTVLARGANRVAIKHEPMDWWLLKLISSQNPSAYHAIADEMGSPPHFACWIFVSKQSELSNHYIWTTVLYVTFMCQKYCKHVTLSTIDPLERMNNGLFLDSSLFFEGYSSLA